MDGAIAGELGDRHFNGDGIHVETCYSVRSEVLGIIGVLILRQPAWNSCPKCARTEIERVKSSAKIDIKRIVNGPGENFDAVAEIVNALLGQVVIIRHGARTDVGRDSE